MWIGSAIVGLIFLGAIINNRQEELSGIAQEKIFTEQLVDRYIFEPGTYSATLMRQSGNVYRELGEFDSAEKAIKQLASSLKRARIMEVNVYFPSKQEVSIVRTIPNARGRAEGKKLRGGTITKVSSETIRSQSQHAVELGGGLNTVLEYLTPLSASFNFHCGHCGAVIPELPDANDEKFVCSECYEEFATRGEVVELINELAETEAITRGWRVIRSGQT